ncbi:MAG: hypothetical protein JXQ83_10565 [Candidatus Glassbacteria bacterium]|nr:hypothetical protein [Candidatus Glassbacteria bacterium]
MRVDSHLHVNFNGWTATAIVDYLDRNDLDRGWLLSWEETDSVNPNYQHLSVEDIFEAYRQFPDRLVPMYAPDPSAENAIDRLVDWAGRGIRGCAELKVSLGWDSALLDNYLDKVCELQLPLVFHMERGFDYLQPAPGSAFEKFLARVLESRRLFCIPARLMDLLCKMSGAMARRKQAMQKIFPGYLLGFAELELRLQQFPGLQIIGHGPYFWQGISSDYGLEGETFPSGAVAGDGPVAGLLERYDNLYADLSGNSGFNALNRDHGYAARFLARFSHKILFGTDNFQLGLPELLESLKLAPAELDKIYGVNAVGLLS